MKRKLLLFGGALVTLTLVFVPQKFDIALASTITAGGTTEIAKRPVDDFYFILMAFLFVLIVVEIVLLILKLIKLKKLKMPTFAIVPYAIATAITPKTAEYILLAEVVVFGALYFVNRFLSRKIKSTKNDK